MTRRDFKVFTIAIFILTAAGIAALLFFPRDRFFSRKGESQTRVVIPQNIGSGGSPGELQENQNLEESSAAKVPFGEGESIVSIIARDFDQDSREEQVIAWRNIQEIDTPIYLTYIDEETPDGADEPSWKRVWTAPTAATRASTLILYSEDLINDGGVCVLVSGMNGAGEQTLTVFRKTGLPGQAGQAQAAADAEPFTKIAEFIIEGSIAVQELRGPQDLEQRGASLSISTYGRDFESENLLDQIETTYAYNPANGLYEQTKAVKIPGYQIEQRRVSELLNSPGAFEKFIDGMWKREKPEGGSQYVYINTRGREVIFYTNDTEEVFNWQESNPTRYGIHIIGRNKTIQYAPNRTNIRRTLNVELESLDSIRLRVFQDVYLRTGPGAAWDGSYAKVKSAAAAKPEEKIQPWLEGVYSAPGEPGAPGGSIAFSSDSTYELRGIGPVQTGRYVFFKLGDDEMLEMRPHSGSRETFRVNRAGDALTLTRVRIGARGLQEMESPVTLAKK